MKKEKIKKILSPKKSDVDRVLWEGCITDKILSIIAIGILVDIVTFLVVSFANL